MNFSIRTKIVLSTITLIILGGLLATYSVYKYTNKYLVAFGRNNIEISNKEKAKETEAVFTIAEKATESITKNESVVDFLVLVDAENKSKSLSEELVLSDEEIAEKKKKNETERVLMEKELSEINLGNMFEILYLIDIDGNVVVSTDNMLLGNNYSFREYFKGAIEKGFFVDFSVGVTTGKPGYYFSRSIHRNEEIVGVVVGKMSSETIEKTLINNIEFGNPNTMFFDKMGVVVYSNKPEKLYKLAGEMTVDEKKSIDVGKRYALKSDIESMGYDFIISAIKEKEIFKTYDFFDSHDNEQELVTFVKIGNFPFYLVSELETEEFLEPAEKVGLILAGIILISVVFVSITISFIVYKFLKPIKDLKKMAYNMSKRDFSEKVNIKTNDELGELGVALNNAAEEIEIMYEKMEDKVNERTKELEKMNSFMVGRELKMIELKNEIEALKNKPKKK